jgi:hypothetical protein
MQSLVLHPTQLDGANVRKKYPNQSSEWADENPPMGYQASAQPTHGPLTN